MVSETSPAVSQGKGHTVKRTDTSIRVIVRLPAATLVFRILEKPSRYARTRYWLVTPARSGSPRWYLVPDLPAAARKIVRIVATEKGGPIS